MMRYVACLLSFTVTISAADLPVREVVLFKHGVGYFARSGRLAAGESARLDFKGEEMNDVLKSLTVEEKGGKISGLRYDSSEPLAKKLEEFPFAIGSQQPLSAVLDQLKGARVELKFGTETVTGAIVGARRLAGGQNQPEHEQATLLESGELRNVDLGAISSLQFSDPKLRLQFKDYLAAIAQSRSKDKRSVYIDSSDSGARDIQASYMIPSPVWKSSYRLIFGETGQPTLEGWAIVDNTTGDDWTNVHLALVSGRPISFVSRLYEPRYVARPEAELAEDAALAPMVDTGALDEEKVQQEAAPPPPAAPAPAFKQFVAPKAVPRRLVGGAVGGVIGGVAQSVEVAAASPSSISQTAVAQELGELFEYRISTPVTIRKSESAMLPFLQDKISARKLLIYADESSAHPLNAAEITNSTGKTLDGGPITVFDAGAYGGEALMETVKTGDKRLLSYAVDLGTRITTQFDSEAAVIRELHVNRGLLTTKRAAVETKTYTIRNVDQKAKTLIIEHPVRPGYTLLERKPTEKTANAYRFEVKLVPNGTEKFPVTEENVFDSTTAVSSLTPDMLVIYISSKNLSDAGRKQLSDILDKKRQINSTDAEKQRVTEQINTIVHDQERIRQNINSLNHVSGQQDQVQKYAKQLGDQEIQLATLRDRQAELERKKAGLQGELNSQIEKMEF